MELSTALATFVSLGIIVVLAETPPSIPLLSVNRKSGCIKVNHCKCIMRDGSGVIDLGVLTDTEGFLDRFKRVSFEDVPGDTEVLVSISPCLPFSEPEDFTVTDCTEVATCLIVRKQMYTNHYINYGRHKGNTFHYNDSLKTLSVSYSVRMYTAAQTVVHYQCSPTRSISYSQNLHANGPLQIWVESPCACPNACALVDVGPDTIFLIILCLSVTAYFIVGSCALRAFRTHNGVQIAPEDSVWCMLCYQFTDQPRTKRKRYSSLREDTP